MCLIYNVKLNAVKLNRVTFFFFNLDKALLISIVYVIALEMCNQNLLSHIHISREREGKDKVNHKQHLKVTFFLTIFFVASYEKDTVKISVS